MPCPCCFDLLLLLSVLFARFAGRRDQKQCAGRAAKNACAMPKRRPARNAHQSCSPPRAAIGIHTDDAACKAGDTPVYSDRRVSSCIFLPDKAGWLATRRYKFLGPDRNSEPETCVLFVLGVIKPRVVPGRERDTHRRGSVAAVWYI